MSTKASRTSWHVAVYEPSEEQGVWGRGVAQWARFSRISCGAMETCRGGESETQIDS